MARALDLAEEGARGEERRREVRAQRRLPPLERELPHRLVGARPDAGDRRADVDAAELLARLREERVDLRLVGEVGAERDRAAELRGERLRALAAAVVVNDDARALGCERARARGADAARRPGDDDALACESGVHERQSSLPRCASTSSATSRASPASSSGAQTGGDQTLYHEGRKLYTEEINAAVRGAKTAGATEIVVMDCHGAGGDYTFNSLLPDRARSRLRVRRPERVDGVHGVPRGGLRRRALRRHARDGGHARRRACRTRCRARRWQNLRFNGRSSARPASTRRSAGTGAARCCSSPATARRAGGDGAARRRPHDGRGEGRPRPLQRALDSRR